VRADHDHDDDLALRVEALEALRVEKGLVNPAAVDAIIRHYEQDVGPMNGARVVARAWAGRAACVSIPISTGLPRRRAAADTDGQGCWLAWRRGLESLLEAKGACASGELDARARALAGRRPGHDHG